MNRLQNKSLLRKLGFNSGGRVNHIGGELQEVQMVPVVTGNKLGQAGQGPFNPPADATIQKQILTYYFTEAAGVYTEITAAALLAAQPTLAVALPVFLYCNIDFEAGYPTFFGQLPITGWTYNAPVQFGKTVRPGDNNGVWDATVNAKLRRGDVVFVYTATLGGVDYTCIKVVRVTNTPYSGLLQATNSNVFTFTMIRYVAADSTAAQLAQFANSIVPGDLTMFGKFTKDSVDPEQQQANIIDIYYEFRVSKQKGLGIYFNYDVVSFRMNFFIAGVEKIV
jgi:hypothetical protein